jgi:hypothetical protein
LADYSSKTYLGDGSCKDHNLIELANSLHELVDAGSLDHVHIVVVTLNFDGNREVGLMEDLWQ